MNDRSEEQKEHDEVNKRLDALEAAVKDTRHFNESSRNINTGEHDFIKGELHDLRVFVDTLMSALNSWTGFMDVIKWLRSIALYGGIAYFIFATFYGSGFGG